VKLATSVQADQVSAQLNGPEQRRKRGGKRDLMLRRCKAGVGEGAGGRGRVRAIVQADAQPRTKEVNGVGGEIEGEKSRSARRTSLSLQLLKRI